MSDKIQEINSNWNEQLNVVVQIWFLLALQEWTADSLLCCAYLNADGGGQNVKP